MTRDARLELRYRRLLRWFPAGYRRDHEEEIVGVLMAAAPPGRQRPGLVDSANLMWAGLRTRLRCRGGTSDTAPHWAEALAIYGLTGPVLLLFTSVLLPVQGRVFTYLLSLREHLVSFGPGRAQWPYLASAALPLAIPAALLVVLLLRRRRTGIIVAGVGALLYGASAVMDSGSIINVAYSSCYLLVAAALAAASPARGRPLMRWRHLVLPAAALLLIRGAGTISFIAGGRHYSHAAPIAQIVTLTAAGGAVAIVLARGSDVDRRYLALLAVTAWPFVYADTVGWRRLPLGANPPAWALVAAALYVPALLTAVLAIRTARQQRRMRATSAGA